MKDHKQCNRYCTSNVQNWIQQNYTKISNSKKEEKYSIQEDTRSQSNFLIITSDSAMPILSHCLPLVKTILWPDVGTMLVNNLSQCKTERKKTRRLDSSLFSAVRGSRLGSMCRLSIGIEGLSRVIGLSKAAVSPHKDSTRWNNAIFAEEEADGDEAAHSDAGKEIKKEGTPTTEGREKKREAKKRTKRRRDREEDEER